jgi:polar amino acid transport system substrate-binding protein
MTRKTLLAAVAALAIAGCGSSNSALDASLKALGTPQAVASAGTTSNPPNVSCANPSVTLHPSGLPAPRLMPAGSYMATILHRGYLIAGVDQGTLLFSSFNPLDGQLEGFEIDLLRQIANAIFGNPNAIQFRAVTTAQRLPAAAGGSVDIVADAITETCYRRTLVDFSSEYYDAGQRLLVNVGSSIHSVADLAGKTVCTQPASTSLINIEHAAPKAIPVLKANRTDCLVALQQGQVAAATTDDTILLGLAAQDPYTRVVGPRFTSEPYGMAISNKHPDFVRFVNAVLAKIRADGTFRSLESHWLARFGPIQAPPPPAYQG